MDGIWMAYGWHVCRTYPVLVHYEGHDFMANLLLGVLGSEGLLLCFEKNQPRESEFLLQILEIFVTHMQLLFLMCHFFQLIGIII